MVTAYMRVQVRDGKAFKPVIRLLCDSEAVEEIIAHS